MKRGRAQTDDRPLTPVARREVFGAAGNGVEIRQIRLERIRALRASRGGDRHCLNMGEIPRVSPQIIGTRQEVPDRLIVAVIEEMPYEISECVGTARGRPAHAMFDDSARIGVSIAALPHELSKTAMSVRIIYIVETFEYCACLNERRDTASKTVRFGVSFAKLCREHIGQLDLADLGFDLGVRHLGVDIMLKSIF